MENQKKTTNSLARRMGISLICGLAAGLLPVSYTHLDVYKRQGLPCIVFSHQDQGPVNVPDLHVPDGLEIVDVKISQLHAPPSL